MNQRTVRTGVVGVLLLVVSGCNSGSHQTSASSSGHSATQAPLSPASSITAPASSVSNFRLLEPADGAQVHQCEIFKGEANLADDQTLVIGVRNIDNGSPERYFEAVENWEYPGDLKQWRGYQYFGSKDTAVGQQFRAEVLIIDLDQARAAIRGAKKEGWHSPDNPPNTKVVAHITLKRVAGPGPTECT